MRRLLVLLPLLVLLVVAAPAQAVALPRDGALHPKLTVADGYLPVTDGRFAAFREPLNRPTPYSPPGNPASGQLQAIRDDLTGKLVRPRPGCTLTPPEGGYAAERCGDGVWRALNLQTGTRAPIPLGGPTAQRLLDVDTVGHDWASWSSVDHASGYVNWRTGEERDSVGEAPFDYDHPAGGALPAPIRGTTVQGVASGTVFVVPPDKPLQALRLELHGRVRTLRKRCLRPGCSAVTYDGGVLTWQEGGAEGDIVVGAYVAGSNRLLDWSTSVPGDGNVRVAQTQRRVYIQTEGPPNRPTTVEQYEAALPTR